MFLATALLLSSAPISGGEAVRAEGTALTELASAFRSICLEQIGDVPGQTRVAAAAPWNFKAGRRQNHYGRGSIDLIVEPETQTCALTTMVADAETIASVQTALADAVSPSDWQELPGGDSRYVIIAHGDGDTQFVIAFKISNSSGRNLTTLSVAKR